MKLGLLAVAGKGGVTIYIEAGRVVTIDAASPAPREGAPTAEIRLENGELVQSFDDPAEIAAQYSQLLERRYPG